jgi:hypothetical protein
VAHSGVNQVGRAWPQASEDGDDEGTLGEGARRLPLTTGGDHPESGVGPIGAMGPGSC